MGGIKKQERKENRKKFHKPMCAERRYDTMGVTMMDIRVNAGETESGVSAQGKHKHGEKTRTNKPGYRARSA
jgi:hypothetical protein